MKLLLRSLLPCLLLLLNCSAISFAQTEDALVKHIKQLQQTVQNRRLTTMQLNSDRPNLLPVGVLGKRDAQPPVIIDDITLFPDHAELMAYAAFKLPGSDEELYFATPQPVTLNYSGGLESVARMALVKERKIRIGNDDTYLTVEKEKSFLEFDCDGFRQAGLGVEVEMTSKLVKENADGTQNLNEKVKGRFSVVFADLSDIIASVSLDPFQIRGLKGVSFTVKDAVIDLSDFQNPLGILFPDEYKESYYADAGCSHGTGARRHHS